MSPLERLLLREHEERITSAKPVDLPMGPSARAAKASKYESPEEKRERLRTKNQRSAAYKQAWKAATLAKRAAERRRVSLAALREGATWAEAAKAAGVSINGLAQTWIVEAEEPPEVTQARRQHTRAKRLARLERQAVSRG